MVEAEVEAMIVEVYQKRVAEDGAPPTARGVAERVGPPATARVVRIVLEKYGLPPGPPARRRLLTPIQEHELFASYMQSDASIAELARVRGVHPSTAARSIARMAGGEIPERTSSVIVEVEVHVDAPPKTYRCLRCDKPVPGQRVCSPCRRLNSAESTGALGV